MTSSGDCVQSSAATDVLNPDAVEEIRGEDEPPVEPAAVLSPRRKVAKTNQKGRSRTIFNLARSIEDRATA